MEIDLNQISMQIQAQLRPEEICLLLDCTEADLRKAYYKLNTGEDFDKFYHRNQVIGIARLKMANYKKRAGIKK